MTKFSYEDALIGIIDGDSTRLVNGVVYDNGLWKAIKTIGEDEYVRYFDTRTEAEVWFNDFGEHPTT